ncbi:hypothetical protein D6D19_06928 [Aureobasidium pullulans]|uniref:Transcription factor domain-containing protein n=1 Tax=Aureobasidium pullulans TaxID=5580 RepID=A0A4S8ZZF3_AURPU|nr:hypothetical protein D6D19_06928 [Aureobasidium pullulans]
MPAMPESRTWQFDQCKATTIAGQRTDLLYEYDQPWLPTSSMNLCFLREDVNSMIDDDESYHEHFEERHYQANSPSHASPDSEKCSSIAEPLHTAIEFFTVKHNYLLAARVELKQEKDGLLESALVDENLLTRWSIPVAQTSYQDTNNHPTCCAILPKFFTQDVTYREVLLIQHFVDKISPWLDICDDAPRFACEVPSRAVQSPILLFSVLAASSRHQALEEDELQEASDYYCKCLELVVQALSQPVSCFDENLLVAIVLLRFYELFSFQAESSLNLDGIACLLSATPMFSISGGLAEAASWIGLGQDLLVAQTNKQAPKYPLENYDRTSAIGRSDAGSAASRIILLLAKIMRRVFSTGSEPHKDSWTYLENSIEDWNDSKGFQPLFRQDARAANKAFPIVSMISAPQVIALQYYHTCQVYLRLYSPNSNIAQQDAIGPMYSVIGLARSNAWVEDANFVACYILRACGHCITNPEQRDQAISFLDYVKGAVGYDTQGIVDMLQSRWTTMDRFIE